MTSVVSNLVRRAFFQSLFHSRNEFLMPCLGCKRSLVQIQSRRPNYLFEIIGFILKSELCKTLQITAHKRSKKNLIAGVSGIVFGTPDIGPFRALLSLFYRILKSNQNILDRWPFWPFQHVQDRFIFKNWGTCTYTKGGLHHA